MCFQQYMIFPPGLLISQVKTMPDEFEGINFDFNKSKNANHANNKQLFSVMTYITLRRLYFQHWRLLMLHFTGRRKERQSLHHAHSIVKQLNGQWEWPEKGVILMESWNIFVWIEYMKVTTELHAPICTLFCSLPYISCFPRARSIKRALCLLLFENYI